MIILLGFPKSGTTSFNRVFKELGLETAHWALPGWRHIGSIIKANKLAGRPLLTELTHLDCITQMDVCISEEHCYWPQLTDYERLYEENRDCLFILNKRVPTDLLDSFKLWRDYCNNYLDRIYKFNPELFEGLDEGTPDERFIALVNRHYNAVERFFASKPTAKFITYQIGQDGIERLSPYIDTKGLAFPHENKRRANAGDDNKGGPM